MTDLHVVDGLLAALPVAVVVVDGDGRITGWNGAAEVLYGHRGVEVLGRRADEVLFEQEDRALGGELLAAGAWEGDCRVRRRDGVLLVSSFRAARLADGSVAWIGNDGIDQGLAEQERAVLLSAEHAARSSAEEAMALVEAIVSAAPVGIAVLDLDFRYVRVNDAYAMVKGRPPDELVGMRLGDVLAVPPAVVADLRRVLATGRPVLARETDLGLPGDRHFHVSYFPVNAGGELVGAGMTTIEVTEVKRAEVERAALLARAEAAQQRLAVLANASSVLTSTMDLDQLLGRLARVLAPTAADWCVIQLFNPGFHVAVSHRDVGAAGELALALEAKPLSLDGDGVIADVLNRGHPRVLSGDDAAEAMPVGLSRPLQSTVVVPIRARGETFGALIMASERVDELEEDDLDLAVEVAHRAALAVSNARAFHQEHQIAETLQRAMLPASLPAIEDLDLAVRYVAATQGAEVGGDWYDVLAFDDAGCVVLTIGDVVGHDIAASTSMGQLRSALRAYACEAPSRPAEAVRRVDRLYDALTLAHATCVLGVVERDPRCFRWSNAGHLPPLLVRNGEGRFLEEGAGAILGVCRGEAVAEASELLFDGDILVLYTDGLVERRGEPLDVGLERLRATAAQFGGGTADDVADTLLTELLPDASRRDDDVAILVVRVGVPVATSATHRVALDADPASAAMARGFLAGVLVGAGRESLVDTATLLASELVTNALRHSAPPYALVVRLMDDGVEVSVQDGLPAPIAPQPADAWSETGRGLLLVGALAESWGVRTRPDGKDTWFRLRDV